MRYFLFTLATNCCGQCCFFPHLSTLCRCILAYVYYSVYKIDQFRVLQIVRHIGIIEHVVSHFLFFLSFFYFLSFRLFFGWHCFHSIMLLLSSQPLPSPLLLLLLLLLISVLMSSSLLLQSIAIAFRTWKYTMQKIHERCVRDLVSETSVLVL